MTKLPVTNEVFEAAWSDDNNRKIISKAFMNFRGKIPKEELTYRAHMALFNCLRNHNPNGPNKFTTSLFKYTVWECRKAMVGQEKSSCTVPLPYHDIATQPTPLEAIYVRDCMDVLPKHHRSILYAYYFEGMTLQEIGDSNGYSRPAAMVKLRQAEAAFRRLYGED